MDTKALIVALRRLTPDEVRQRLAELEAEAKSWRALLRSAIASENARKRQETRDVA
jgi:hypothetical protein